jgi:hypothetical protein
MNTPEIRGLRTMLDGFTGRWKATGEVDGVGGLEAWGESLITAMALQALVRQRVAEHAQEEPRC